NEPAGLLVGLVKAADPAAGEQPGPSAGTGEPVDWFEVLGSDAGRTQRFYADLFGWRLGGDDTAEGYAMADTGAGRGIQGGLGASEQSRWATIYASVSDVEQTLARAESLGGSPVYRPPGPGDPQPTRGVPGPAGDAVSA